MVWNSEASTSLYERTSSTADEQFLLKHPVRELQTELSEFFYEWESINETFESVSKVLRAGE